MHLDFYEYGGLGDAASRSRKSKTSPKPWLMVYFRCCHTYGRLTRNRQQTMYIGRCPRCGAAVRARIGPGGTSQRMFEAH